MKKETARFLGPLVKTDKYYRALQDYALDRIEYHKGELVIAKTIEDVRFHQGAIKELKRFETLRETAEQAIKE